MADASDCDGFNRVPTEEKEKEMAVSEEGEEERSRVLDLAKEAATAQEQPLAEAEKEHESLDLEAKKRRLLEELESALLPKGKPKDSTPTNQQDLPPPVTAVAGPSIGLGLGFEVIDETALVETLSLPSAAAGIRKGKKGSANVAEAKKDGNKQLASRRKAKKDARNSRARRNTTTTTTSTEAPNGKNMVKRRYSRKEMEALRFVNVDQQRNFWNEIYAGLRNHFANEYDTMAVSPVSGNGPRPLCLPNNKHAPPILSAESCENGSPVDPSRGHSLISEDGCSVLEECSEDDDSEDDYASIQRPAFLIDGEPNFDSGPPEDGWEYLRRVRWEADQIPKVKVAKLDRSKLNKEQSPYMPKIPDIAECPEHLLPLKEWEDVFLAEFSALRASLSCLEGSNAMTSSNLQPVHSSQLHASNFGESASVMSKDVVVHCHLSASKAIDPLLNLTSEDKDTTLPPEHSGSNTSIDQASSCSETPSPPLLSAILGMDSVARVSMLLKQIRLLEPANTITRDDCMWLFALSATVDAPLDADTCAALRSLLRKCASIRAGKAELDDEVVMLNILATISGRYFGQSES